MQYVIGIDIGGTCTDCVAIDETGRVALVKAFSTPPDFSGGIMAALARAGAALDIDRATLLQNTRLFLHSTTVAENAVVDSTLATAGLITNRGFEDTLFAMRGGYGRWSGLTEEEKRNPIETGKPGPVIPRALIRGIKERTDREGSVLLAPDPEQVKAAVSSLLAAGADAIAVSLLWSFVNPASEKQVAEMIREMAPHIFVTLSHEIAPILGEYERTSTAALNARLGPVVAGYLDNLRGQLQEHGFTGTLLVMQAYGGLLPIDEAAHRPVGMIESGPVAGLLGCRYTGGQMGVHNIIAADMGGTTFKVGVVREGLIEYQRESMVLRHHYALPKMDVVSLGLAGGSIISLDQRTGYPRLGPNSAGSYPGPVCYDHGGDEPTVTDVDAILGYLNPDYFLGGGTALNIDRARQVFRQKIADPLGMPLIEAAAAVYKLANSMIYDLLHKVTVQRGLDPRQFTLFSFGGTAGMHVAAYGDELGVQQIVIPHSASVHGAYGLSTSNIVYEEQVTQPLRVPAGLPTVNQLFDSLRRRVTGALNAAGFTSADIQLQYTIDMRYRRQVHILTVPVTPAGHSLTDADIAATLARFESLYQEKYGPDSAFSEAGMEFVSFRVRGEGLVQTPALRIHELSDSCADAAIVEIRLAWTHRKQALIDMKGYDFTRLRPGNIVPGPAIIWTPITTVVLDGGHRAGVDAAKNLIITRNH